MQMTPAARIRKNFARAFLIVLGGVVLAYAVMAFQEEENNQIKLIKAVGKLNLYFKAHGAYPSELEFNELILGPERISTRFFEYKSSDDKFVLRLKGSRRAFIGENGTANPSLDLN